METKDVTGRRGIFPLRIHVPQDRDAGSAPRDVEFLNAGSVTEDLVRSRDWSKTPLGPIATWPDCLRSAVNLMLPARSQIVLFWGPEFVALYNDAYATTIGEKHPRALGRPARESWSELWPDLEPLLMRVFKEGQTVSATDHPFYIERRGYPEYVYFDISYSPVRDDAGAVRGVFCIVNETTERVLAQRALRESEDRLKAIVTQAATGLVLTDPAGRFMLVNARFCEIVGYTEPELLQMNVAAIIHPEDLDDHETRFRHLTAQGAGFVAEQRYVRKDGSLVWVSNSVGPVRDASGEVGQAGMVVTDITERKRAAEVERRLAAIIESSEDAILSIDLDMVITSWNEGAERLYGYTAEEAIGKRVSMLVPEGRPDEEASIVGRIRRGERVEHHETKRRRRDGRLIDVSLAVSPVRDEHGRIVGASKIARDISSRKEMERLQHVLMGEMKHRVKNILATVQAIARQTFRTDRDLDAARKAFDSRLTSLSRAHDLLTRARWDGADLADVVAGALGPYPQERFEIGGPPLQLPPKVVLVMSLALHELATNAAKFGALSAPEGSVAITWTADPRRFVLRWQEAGGPPVSAPGHRGFGSLLIEQVLAAELNGKVLLSYAPSGLECSIDASLEGAWEVD